MEGKGNAVIIFSISANYNQEMQVNCKKTNKKEIFSNYDLNYWDKLGKINVLIKF